MPKIMHTKRVEEACGAELRASMLGLLVEELRKMDRARLEAATAQDPATFERMKHGRLRENGSLGTRKGLAIVTRKPYQKDGRGSKLAGMRHVV